jgi:hypothetical protein
MLKIMLNSSHGAKNPIVIKMLLLANLLLSFYVNSVGSDGKHIAYLLRNVKCKEAGANCTSFGHVFVIKRDELSAAKAMKGNATVAAFFDLEEDVSVGNSLLATHYIHTLDFQYLHKTLS